MLKAIEISYIERKLEEQLADRPKPIIQQVVDKVTSSLEPRFPKSLRPFFNTCPVDFVSSNLNSSFSPPIIFFCIVQSVKFTSKFI